VDSTIAGVRHRQYGNLAIVNRVSLLREPCVTNYDRLQIWASRIASGVGQLRLQRVLVERHLLQMWSYVQGHQDVIPVFAGRFFSIGCWGLIE